MLCHAWFEVFVVPPLGGKSRLEAGTTNEVPISPKAVAVGSGLNDFQLIDLRRHDEIVFGQSAKGVGSEFDPGIAITFEMQVGMMSFGFGQFRHAVEFLRHRGK